MKEISDAKVVEVERVSREAKPEVIIEPYKQVKWSDYDHWFKRIDKKTQDELHWGMLKLRESLIKSKTNTLIQDFDTKITDEDYNACKIHDDVEQII